MNSEDREQAEREVRQRLFAMQDPSYRDFHSKLIPTVAKERVIGVRTPRLRQFAKEFAKSPQAAEFLKLLPHTYYEENNLHGFLIAGMKDYGKCLAALEEFLPYIDNWATCDLISPKCLKKHLPELLVSVKGWLGSEHPYTVRFAIGMLMSFYLDEAFDPEYPKLVAKVRSEEYYVNMMVAWYFATALAKQYETVLSYIEERRLSPWCHNKAIQKSVESYRITEEQKAYLKSLKWKKEETHGSRKPQ